FFQAEDGIRVLIVTGVQTCALPILPRAVVLADRHGPFLGDVLVARDRDDEEIAKRARVLEMNEVPHVHQIEGAVAQDDFLIAIRSEERRVGKKCRSRWWVVAGKVTT